MFLVKLIVFSRKYIDLGEQVPQLSSGLVIAGAYADKIRRTLFAQLKDSIRKGEITAQEVARAAGELNRILYHILVEELKTDKGDVVRVRISYDVEDGKIKWDYDSLRLEVFRRVPEEEVGKAVREITAKIEEVLKRVVQYTIEKVLSTKLGDHIYWLKLGEKKVGATIVTPINGEVLIRAAVLDPSPMIVERTRVPLIDQDIDKTLQENISEVIRAGRHVESGEVMEIIRSIEAFIKAIKGEVEGIEKPYEEE